MLRDLTPYLMGDPIATYRREPTEVEKGRDTHELKWSRAKIPVVTPRRRRYTKTSIIWTVKVGEPILRMTKGQAIYLYQRLKREGWEATMRVNKCGGGYYVERTA